MANAPFSRYPYPYNTYYNRYYQQYRNQTQYHQAQKKETVEQENRNTYQKQETNNKKRTSRYNAFGPINFKDPFSWDLEEPVIEILGISLYLDDLIILGLLFFLYKEGVKDEMLFFSLVFLLLS